ncbi:pyridoxal-phosphate-dependent aminotransferase family protein [Desulfitobacterium hafniense]|uniref:Aminotransferase class V domain-containing protein n=5 Tax=root TaxID=1 RepID=Q24MK2_DESHY|nr:alanine--glyoxylate aminotransferase family protein [Desulfitobacterium hafniense]ACL22845.1 Alanine--glyoxylate transaminase [Desulfitobacterium hafniense DCB-2]EHL05239.1 aminotransferase, class V [Desulfitobacterium hafniense DP7]KTE93523.1 serine-pyruvate aminotransferase [Desulfitobacterium hafniense]MEA5025646.1 alanine--glyoxylate aminotransferase family protein [Desulfitobacterium hafniense]CDX05109.1 Soluble hydrogenase, small subunit [Desulfitobacterium hafniense]
MPNKEMLLIPGPTPVVDEIYEALAQETYSHTDPRLVKRFKNSLDMTKRLFNTDGEVFVVAGSGTLSMEMAIVNTVAPGEKILVISHGYFGDRFIPLAQAHGIQVEVLQSQWGKHVEISAVEEKLAEGGFKAVTVTHADTSTGVMSNLEELVPAVKKYGPLFILDGVCASAAIEENMQKEYGHPDYRIDLVLTGSQKAIGVPPGLAIVAFGPKALKAREAMDKVAAYYMDILRWLPTMQDPGKYYATHPVNMIYAYEKGMELVMAEGLEARYKRHAALGKAVRAGLAQYGMRALAPEEIAAPTLSCILYPEGVNDAEFRSKLAEKGMVIAGSLANLAGKAFRIGHMGNATEEMFIKAMELVGETLNEMGLRADPAKAVETFKNVYHEGLGK